jgi:hypothetical protein
MLKEEITYWHQRTTRSKPNILPGLQTTATTLSSRWHTPSEQDISYNTTISIAIKTISNNFTKETRTGTPHPLLT